MYRASSVRLDAREPAIMRLLPLLAFGTAIAVGTATDPKPAVLRYGTTVAEMERALDGQCSKRVTRSIDPPFLIFRDSTHRQQQIDCDGFAFLGAPRWAEFVFTDDSLSMAWIMTTDAESTSIRARLSEAYGDPTAKNQIFVAFADSGAALRTDKAEVLFFSPRIKNRVMPWFGPHSTFR